MMMVCSSSLARSRGKYKADQCTERRFAFGSKDEMRAGLLIRKKPRIPGSVPSLIDVLYPLE